MLWSYEKIVSGQCKFGALINSILCSKPLLGLVPRFKNSPLLTSSRLKGTCIWSSINLRANFDPTTVIFLFNSRRLPINPE